MSAWLTSRGWHGEYRRRAYTLIELMVVIATIAVLAALLLPALARAKKSAQHAACLSRLKQQGIAWRLYLDDNAARFPDRRDLKTALFGGYQSWSTWPKSDPRRRLGCAGLEQHPPRGGKLELPRAGSR